MEGNQEDYPDYAGELQKCKDFLTQYQVRARELAFEYLVHYCTSSGAAQQQLLAVDWVVGQYVLSLLGSPMLRYY